MSKIEWTEETWNPFVGCSKVSEGCKNCYAEKMAYRLANMALKKESFDSCDGYLHVINIDKKCWNGKTFFQHSQLGKPFKRKKPTKYFVCSMSDLFHEDNDFVDILKVWYVMCQNPHHIFQVLTKRPDRMIEFYHYMGKIHKDVGYDSDYYVGTPDHIWIGVTVENQEMADKNIPILLDIPAKTRFLSCEPLLGNIDLTSLKDGIGLTCNALDGSYYDSGVKYLDIKGRYLSWVIIGGESGSNARFMHPNWAKNIIAQCDAANVPVFFKQWGEYAPFENIPLDGSSKMKTHNFDDGTIVYRIGKKKAGNIIHGTKYEQYPE